MFLLQIIEVERLVMTGPTSPEQNCAPGLAVNTGGGLVSVDGLVLLPYMDHVLFVGRFSHYLYSTIILFIPNFKSI